MKQAEGAREVLVVTGRGNRSADRVPVVREAVRRLLAQLSTRGVVENHSEHSPGSFAVRLAPFQAAHARRAESGDVPEQAPPPPTLDGLSAETRDQLRVLAEASLHQLGVRTATPAFVQDEMLRQCAQLAAAIPPSAVSALERERALQAAITRAIERLEDT